MLKNELNGETYNPAIAAASNFIGQKLFAYISHGKNINDRIRDKFRKSLIFIGDEGQIYQPLTNTYIGIGQTAYTAAITYIEEAHEKIDALNKMLTSSMVTSIYANWGKDTWQTLAKVADKDASDTEVTYYRPGKFNSDFKAENKLDGETFESLMPTKVYATNDIILRGIGDYDPETKLAYTRETAHVYDTNLKDDDETTASAKKAILEGSYVVNDTNRAFATSGITVSLEKGLNRYMFTYTFTTPDMIPGANYGIWTEEDEKTASKTTTWSKSITVYFTKDELDSARSNPSHRYEIPDYENIPELNDNAFREDAKDSSKYEYVDSFNAFFNGLNPVYDDGFGLKYTEDKTKYKYVTTEWIKTWRASNIGKDESEMWDDPNIPTADSIFEFWKDPYYLKHQLFKQGKNTISIDDKLTWSYISSAYSYALDFSKEYTDSQVERIYKELLGETSTTLIPVGFEQVAVQIVKDDATRDLDNVDISWDETEGKWVTTIKNNAGDNLPESSSELHKYKLNEGSIYVRSFPLSSFTDDLYSTTVNTNAHIYSETSSETVLPWFVLVKAAQYVENYVKEYKRAYTNNPELETIDGVYKFKSNQEPLDGNWANPGLASPFADKDASGNNTGYFTYASDYKGLIDQAFKHIGEMSWKVFDPNHELNGTNEWTKYTFNFATADLNEVLFMGYERDTNYHNIRSGIDGEENIEFLAETDYSNWPNKNYDREGDTTLNDEEGNRKDDETLKSENDLSKYDGDPGAGIDPENPEDGKFGLPAGNEWGNDENIEHGYFGSEYSLKLVYRIIDDLEEDVTESLKKKDLGTGELYPDGNTLDLYVINTKWSPMAEMNLADGIQTLKEVAYVLDIITDGWGNHYEDGEGNGILLTYTIANNHDRIVDHERRLKAIESGENVVKGIGRLDYLTSSYVNMTVTSDILWKFKYMNATFEEALTDNTYISEVAINKGGENEDYTTTEDYERDFPDDLWSLTSPNFGFNESKDWLGFWDIAHTGAYSEIDEKEVFNSTYGIKISRIPTSYIITYNTMMKAFIADSLYRNAEGRFHEDTLGIPNSRPIWTDICPGLRGVGTLTCVSETSREKHKPGKESTYIFQTPDARYMAIHSYVGHVGIGIDLKLAQTYTTTKNLHDGLGNAIGFVCVDIHSPLIAKKVDIYAYLPSEVPTNANITYFDGYNENVTNTNDGLVNVNNHEKRYVVENNNDDTDSNKSLNGILLADKSVEDKINLLYGFDDDSSTDKGLLLERLYEMGIITKTDETYNLGDNINSITFVQIDGANHDKAYFEFDYVIDVNNAVDTNFAGDDEYTGRLYTDEPDVYTDLYPNNDTIGGAQKFANFVISSTKSPRLFIRYKASTSQVNAVDLTTEGLTTTSWVRTFVEATSDSVKNEIKKVEFDSYRYAENLIKSLDSNFEAERGKMVVGITQRNGIVTPILSDLPKDEFTASYVVWGENSQLKREYVPVTSNQIENEILTATKSTDDEILVDVAKDFPLYVRAAGVYDYVLITDPSDINELNPTDPVSQGEMQGDYANIGNKHNFIITSEVLYTINADNQYVPVTSVYTNTSVDRQIVSSWKVGFDYEHYIPLFYQTQGYVRIDGAQLVKKDDDYTITVDGNEYSTSNTIANSQIFTAKVASEDKAERKYISAKVTQHTAKDGGKGGNSMEVTAHITKLADATKQNSGLVDAYDVRETLDSMFEWVDLSRWDIDVDDAHINPINTLSNEQGGYRDAASNVINAQALGSTVYPLNYFTDKEIVDGKGQLSDDMEKWYTDNGKSPE